MAAVDDGITAAIGVLNADLERQVGRVAELRALVARLESYAGTNGTAEPTAMPPPAVKKKPRAPVRPRIDDDAAERRAKAAAKMRARRQKLRDEAAAKPPAKPKAKPRKKADAPSADKTPEPAADVPAAANGRKRNGGRPPVIHYTSGVKGKLTKWTTDAEGNASRSLVAPGEHVPLMDEGLVAPR